MQNDNKKDEEEDDGWDPAAPRYKQYMDKRIRLYRKYLRNQFAEGGVTREQAFRQSAYADLAAQQSQANDQAQRAIMGSFGTNQPTGLTAEMMRQSALGADYGGADLAAREAGRQAMMQTGQELEAQKQRQANWYVSVVVPLLQKMSMDVQKEIAEAQISAAAGAAGG